MPANDDDDDDNRLLYGWRSTLARANTHTHTGVARRDDERARRIRGPRQQWAYKVRYHYVAATARLYAPASAPN